MSVCIFCEKEIDHEAIIFKLKRGSHGNYIAGFRDSGMEIHSRCLMKFLWDREYPELKLQDITYNHLHKGKSYKDGPFWKIGTYKLTKYTQEEIEKKERNHYKKIAKELLGK